MNQKKLLLAIIIVLILIIICILILIKNLNKVEEEEYNLSSDELIVKEEISSVLDNVSIRNDYYIVKKCVENYYYYYTLANNDIQNYYIVYDMLDNQYIKHNNLTKENIATKLPEIEDSIVNITNMYVSEQSTYISVYLVKGYLRNKQNSNITQFNLIVKLDAANGTFSIQLEDYILETYGTLNLGSSFSVKMVENIELNNNNSYQYKHISDEVYTEDLFNKFKEEIIYNPSIVYNRLDKEYREKRFETFENFNKYVKNNVKKIVIAKLDKYQINTEDNQVEYIFIDKNGKYYIFKETAVMNYSLILDTYTIDLPEFLEKYNEANTMEKVGYNIKKCIDAINDKNYMYVYNKLDETFKNNNYPTIEEFENIIKNNLFENNIVDSVSTINEGDIYVYKINIFNLPEKNNNKQMTIIMQLKEGTDFIMSFSFK